MNSIAIYFRISTVKQELTIQRDAVEAWLKSLPADKKPKKVRMFQDEGRSGKDNNRPGFATMIELARAGEVDTIVCYTLDRFSRSASFAIRTILELDSCGVAFISITQPILNLGHENPFRRTMLAAFSEIAEIERDVIVQRVKDGLAAAVRRGKKLGPKGISKLKKAQIIELFDIQTPKAEIARKLRISRTTVWSFLKSEGYCFAPDPAELKEA